MSHFQAFDNDDDLLKSIAQAREAADARVEDFQARLKPGDLCLSYNAECELFVFHEVRDPLAGVRDPEEREYLRDSYAEPSMKHYRFTKSYSAMCPEGELGDIHVSIVSAVIPASVFEQCREWHWHDAKRIVALLKENSERIAALTFGRVQDGQN